MSAARESGTIYGRIITGGDVERAVLATLREHAAEYVEEVERQQGREPGALARPRGYIVASQFQRWPEDQLPVVVVISPGFAGPPRRAGDGRIMARWSVGVGVIVSSAHREAARDNGQLYAAAMRALVLQHEDLGGLAAGVELQDEDYSDFPFISTRTLMSARVLFSATVDDVTSAGWGSPPWGRPPTPTDPTDPPSWPTVRRASVELLLTDDPTEE